MVEFMSANFVVAWKNQYQEMIDISHIIFNKCQYKKKRYPIEINLYICVCIYVTNCNNNWLQHTILVHICIRFFNKFIFREDAIVICVKIIKDRILENEINSGVSAKLLPWQGSVTWFDKMISMAIMVFGFFFLNTIQVQSTFGNTSIKYHENIVRYLSKVSRVYIGCI